MRNTYYFIFTISSIRIIYLVQYYIILSIREIQFPKYLTSELRFRQHSEYKVSDKIHWEYFLSKYLE